MEHPAVRTLRVPLPRHAFSPREQARAADLWRVLQDVAVEASSMVGWPPARYRAAGTAFVVRAATVVHHREAHYGESVEARTWVWRFVRGTLCTREIRLSVDGEPLLSASQQWAHVAYDGHRMRPEPAPEALRKAFEDTPLEPSVELPAIEGPASEQVHRFELRVWETWMDPLAHVNHPTYLGWAEEALARRLSEAGIDPARVVSVAERAIFHRGVVAGERVTVTTRRLGRVGGDAVAFEHRVLGADGQPAVRLRTVRALHEGDRRLLEEAVP